MWRNLLSPRSIVVIIQDTKDGSWSLCWDFVWTSNILSNIVEKDKLIKTNGLIGFVINPQNSWDSVYS